MRPPFTDWATSKGGIYLPDKKEPTLATWQPYQMDILSHIFPPGEARLPYSEVLWSEPKKSGKTLLAAAIHLYYAIFVDVPAENYAVAHDLEGAADRTFQAVRRSLEQAAKVPGSGIRETNWSVAGTRIRLSNGSEIKALANDYRGGAGGNQSLATIDEVWSFTRPQDLGMLTEFAPVPTRENSMTFYTGYQGYVSDVSYWHNLIDGVLTAGEPVPGLEHIDDGEGQPACWRHGRTFLFYSHLPRHPWHTPEYLAERQARMPLSEYLRVWRNYRTQNSNALCSDEQWDKLGDSSLRSLFQGDRRPVVLGVDAATKKDCAALVGTTLNTANGKIEVCYSKVWTPGLHDPIKLTETIGPEIVRLHREYNVLACYFDPFQMAAISEMCTKAGVKMVEFPQTSRRVQSDTHLQDLIVGNNLAHYGDLELKAHVTSAVTKAQGDRGIRIFKELSQTKIDAAVALSMSALGCQELMGRHTGEFNATNNPFYK